MGIQPVTINNSRLKVEIAQPGTVYTGSRFDWSGFITQVTLDEKHTFCMPESLKPGQGTGGIGFCNEFGNQLAVGYDEAAPGESFPKLGIGLLERPDAEGYNFFRPHKIVENFPIQVEPESDRVLFTVEPINCRGYAARLKKNICLEDDILTIAYTLENTGSKPILTHEYCHNFMGIDRQPVGPDYRLSFPQAVIREPPPAQFYRMVPRTLRWLPKPALRWLIGRYLRRMDHSMQMQEQSITWGQVPESQFFARLQGALPRQQAQWTLTHIPSGLSVNETVDFSPSALVVWGAAHVVSAEVYTDLDIPPGESHSWSRSFRFYTHLSA